MSHTRLKNNDKAHQLFRNLQEDQNNNGFYAVAANYRARSVPGHFDLTTQSNLPVKDDLKSLEIANFNENINIDEEDSPNKLNLYEKFIQNKKKNFLQENTRDIASESQVASIFKKPYLQKRFLRATGFLRVGLLDWAIGNSMKLKRRLRPRIPLRN